MVRDEVFARGGFAPMLVLGVDVQGTRELIESRAQPSL
jgi:hypothetical protein